MDGDEYVGLVLVCYAGTFVQRYKHVSLAGVDNLYVGTFALDVSPEG